MESERLRARRLIKALFKIDEVYFKNEQNLNLTGSELCLLYALDDGEPRSQRQISEEWMISKTTLNTIVKKWERQGLLVQTKIPGTRREMALTLTEKGRRVADLYNEPVYKVETAAVARTVEKYSESFIEAIEYFGRSLQEEFEKQSAEEGRS